MIEFFFMVVKSQPLIMVALGCLVLSAFVALIWGRDFNSPHNLCLFPNNKEEKWPHWVCGLLLTASLVIWGVLIVMNHTTIANDILSFVVVILGSALLIYAAQILYLALMVFFVALVMGIWWMGSRFIVKD
ncbi:MAG: hypothetical protein J6Y53_00450 [Alphaproteobacteria bacterium]|nr:hypothetical protein [Alphaproteobacteria bacterium]